MQHRKVAPIAISIPISIPSAIKAYAFDGAAAKNRKT
jgi:hypothetical protein